MSLIIEQGLMADRHRKRDLDHWGRSCLSKKQFVLMSDGEKAANIASKKRGTRHYCYACTHCYGYHIARLERPK